MKIIDNINQLLGDDIKQTITPNTKLQIAASCFSIYAYEALKKELKDIDSLEFIFTSPTFIPNEAIDNIKKDGSTSPIGFKASNLMIINLNLVDKVRKAKLKVEDKAKKTKVEDKVKKTKVEVKKEKK